MLSNESLSQLIGQIYESAISGDWHDCIENIRLLTDSNKIFFVIRNLDDPEPMVTEFVAGFEYDPNILVEYASRIEDDPWYQTAQLALEGDVLRHSDIKPIETFEHSDMYQNIFLPMRSHHCIGAVVIRNDKHEANFAINRGRADAPYSEKDYELVELIVPHLTRAISLYIELKAYKNAANVVEAVMRNSAKAVFLCDENAGILEANTAASELIGTSEYFKRNPEVLSLKRDYQNATIKKMIADNAVFSSENIRCRQVIMLDEEHDNLLVEVTPLNNKHYLPGREIDCCIVTVTPENRVNWPAVKTEYGLTPKELEVTGRMYGKKSVADIAEELSMKQNTVRTHLQNIYAKFRVNSQAELVVMLNMFSD